MRTIFAAKTFAISSENQFINSHIVISGRKAFTRDVEGQFTDAIELGGRAISTRKKGIHASNGHGDRANVISKNEQASRSEIRIGGGMFFT